MSSREEFTFPLGDAAEEYVEMIVLDMMRTFDLRRSQVVRILNRHWDGVSIDDANLLGHEEPDWWAKEIYEQHAEWLAAQDVDRNPIDGMSI